MTQQYTDIAVEASKAAPVVTATSISGNIIRNAGASFQVGQVALKVIFEPYIL